MNKTLFVTGASNGIGKATVKFFQEKGWNVVATMRSPEKEEELTRLDNVLVTRLDVCGGASITPAVEAGIEKFGRIDVLLNNAGNAFYGLLEATPMEHFRSQFETNVFGLLAVTKAVLPHFRKNRSGVVINMSSLSGKLAFPLDAAYSGSKFAVEGISEALRFELEALGVKMKIIEPGMIDTDCCSNAIFDNDESLTEYQALVGQCLAAYAEMDKHLSPAVVVAEAVYAAATDGTDQLRYTAGEDAREYMADLRALDDAAFAGKFRKRLGI